MAKEDFAEMSCYVREMLRDKLDRESYLRDCSPKNGERTRREPRKSRYAVGQGHERMERLSYR